MPDQLFPQSLWHDNALRVPTALLAAYEDSIDRLGLQRIMADGSVTGSVGGASTAEFHEHYATRFRVSACRALAALIDPSRKFGSLSSDLLTTLAAGRICLLDAPAGPSTASLAFLTALIEIRACRILPTLPLTVDLHAAEISADALQLGKELLEHVTGPLGDVAIAVKYHPHRWNAESVPETSALMDALHAATPNPAEYLFVSANFSGTASAKGPDQAKQAYDRFGPSLEHIQGRLVRRSTFLWIEPRSAEAKSFLKLLRTSVQRVFKEKPDLRELAHEYNWYDSLQLRVWPCRILIQRYARTA